MTGPLSSLLAVGLLLCVLAWCFLKLSSGFEPVRKSVPYLGWFLEVFWLPSLESQPAVQKQCRIKGSQNLCGY